VGILSSSFLLLWYASTRFPLHNPNFLVGQAVGLEDELVDLSVGGFDLALDERFLVVGLVNYIGLQGQAPFVGLSIHGFKMEFASPEFVCRALCWASFHVS